LQRQLQQKGFRIETAHWYGEKTANSLIISLLAGKSIATPVMMNRGSCANDHLAADLHVTQNG
jgi:hypothetical protein